MLDIISFCSHWTPSPRYHCISCSGDLVICHMHVSNSQMLAWKSQRFIQGGGGQHEILVGAIEPYIVVGDDPDDNCAFVFHDHVDSLRQLAYPVCNKFVHASVPLQNMLPYMSVKMTFKVAKLHKIAIGSHIPKSELSSYFKNHSCGSCNLYLSIFSIVQSWSAREKNCFRVRRSKPDKNGADSHKRNFLKYQGESWRIQIDNNHHLFHSTLHLHSPTFHLFCQMTACHTELSVISVQVQHLSQLRKPDALYVGS